MTNCTQESIESPRVNGRAVEVNFQGGDITSDGGVLLLRQVEHEGLRQDVAMQTAVERDQVLASSPTLCRFENQADAETAVRLHEVLVDQFIGLFKRAPKKLMLDFDATDDAVQGEQDRRFFHGYYDHYCFLPLYVFCGHQLLVSYLRPSNIDSAKHAWVILALLVKRPRQCWPKVRIIFRGDGGLCRWKMLHWCGRHGIGYIVGLAKNPRLNACTKVLQGEAAEWRPISRVIRNGSTINSTARAAIWRTASRRANSTCSAVARPVSVGGRISSGCCFPRSPTH